MPDFNSLEELVEYHKLPFHLRADQVEDVENLYGYDRVALFNEVGTGKTATGTCILLAWDRRHNFILVPPILQRQWYLWLTSLHDHGGVVIYRGTPEQRKSIDIVSPRWVIMTLPIFKRDLAHIKSKLGRVPEPGTVTVTVDEAHSLKNVGSANHKTVRDFVLGQNLLMLTGTPVTSPHDVYAYVKLKTPGVYRSQAHFENLHVEERDYFGNVTKWKNLELLNKNLMLQASRRLSREVLKDLKEPNYIPIYYELEPEHLRLYNQLADEQLLLLPDGGKIDATSAGRLYNAIQQIVCNWRYFSGVPEVRPAIFDLLDEVASEINLSDPASSKLIVYTYYVMTSRLMLEYLAPYQAVGCYSEISAKQQDRNIARFLEDPSCRILVAQPGSGGMGWNPQKVCWEILFVEEPVSPLHFIQGVGRVDRDGQEHAPNIRLAIAEGTIQRRLHHRLLDKDALANEVQGGYKDLRDAIHGR